MSGGSSPFSWSEEEELMTCAACGGGDEYNLKWCTACRSVRYCDRTCQAKHWKQHRAECKRLAAQETLINRMIAHEGGITEEEARDARRLHEELQRTKRFVPPPPPECHICFHRLPNDPGGQTFQPCCGNVICFGCEFDNMKVVLDKMGALSPVTCDAAVYKKHSACAFCRAKDSTTIGESVARMKARVDAGSLVAMRCLADVYKEDGERVLEAVDLYTRAADGGDAVSAYTLGAYYYNGGGFVKKDITKALHFLKKGAGLGCVLSRVAIANHHQNERVKQKDSDEIRRMHLELSLAHWAIAAKGGSEEALKRISDAFIADRKLEAEKGYDDSDPIVSKDEYREILHAYKQSREELDTPSRRKAKLVLVDFPKLLVKG